MIKLGRPHHFSIGISAYRLVKIVMMMVAARVRVMIVVVVSPNLMLTGRIMIAKDKQTLAWYQNFLVKNGPVVKCRVMRPTMPVGSKAAMSQIDQFNIDIIRY